MPVSSCRWGFYLRGGVRNSACVQAHRKDGFKRPYSDVGRSLRRDGRRRPPIDALKTGRFSGASGADLKNRALRFTARGPAARGREFCSHLFTALKGRSSTEHSPGLCHMSHGGPKKVLAFVVCSCYKVSCWSDRTIHLRALQSRPKWQAYIGRRHPRLDLSTATGFSNFCEFQICEFQICEGKPCRAKSP